MRRLATFAMLYLLAISATGCATIINGPTQDVPVASEPSGAAVVIDGIQTMYTPCTLELERKNGHSLLFKKDGYEEQVIMLDSQGTGLILGNIIIGGIIGVAVDASNGSYNKLVPDEVKVVLQPLEDPVAKEEDAEIEAEEAPPSDEDMGQSPPEPDAAQAAPPEAAPDDGPADDAAVTGDT